MPDIIINVLAGIGALTIIAGLLVGGFLLFIGQFKEMP